MSAELLALVPAELRYERVPLADCENAHSLWRQAVELLTDNEAISSALDRFIGGSCAGGVCETAPPEPIPPRDNFVSPWDLLERYKPAIDLVEAGIARGRLQLPEARGYASFDEVCCGGAVTSRIRPIARLLRLRAKAYAAVGEFELALASVNSILRIAEMLLHADGVDITFLIAVAYHGIALTAAQELAAAPEIPATALRELLGLLDRDPEFRRSYIDCLRNDFCSITVHGLDPLPDGGEVTDLVDTMIAHFYPSTPTLDIEDEGATPVPVDGRIATRRRRILQVLTGHPHPLNKIKTIESLLPNLMENLDQARRTWQSVGRSRWQKLWERLWRRERKLRELWPFQLTAWAPYEFLSVDDEVPKIVKDSFSPSDRCYKNYLPPSDRTLAKLRAACLRHSNPVGELLHGSFVNGGFGFSIAVRTEAHLAATRTIVALRLFVREQGHWPKNLQELVTTGTVSELPLDPFSGRPLVYNAEERSVSTVGGRTGEHPQMHLFWPL